MYGFRHWSSKHYKELEDEEKAEEDELLSANQLSMSAWKYAQSPNYNCNENFFYAYSELDYVGEYTLVQIPSPAQEYIDHVDYWGEGRVVTEEGIAGFPCCYNVNERYKLVSGGADVDRKIPNRIPVFSSADCDTSSYIRDKSVKLVTLSGGRISRRCARDVARVVARNEGLVVAFGYDHESEDIKNLEKALSKENLVHFPGQRVPPLLLEITAFHTRRIYVHVEHLDEQLQRNISERHFEDALNISRVLIVNKYSSRIYNVVMKMVKESGREGHESVMWYVYWMWSRGERALLHAPLASVLNGEAVTVLHGTSNLPLKLESDKPCGVSAGNEITNTWKFIPIWENNSLSFKLQNVHSKLFLTLHGNKVYGKRQLIGSSLSRELKFNWSLAPLHRDNNLYFYIVNKQFGEGLAMDSEIKQGGRHAVSIEGPVNQPEIYAWKVGTANDLC